MKVEEIVRALQDALKSELAAIEMYGAHAKAIKEPSIAQGVQAILEVEQEHAASLSRRIRQLGASPAEPGQASGVVGRAASAGSEHLPTVELLRMELAEEQTAIKHYAATVAGIMDDEDTIALLSEHLQDEMAHALWMKRQIRALSGGGQ